MTDVLIRPLLQIAYYFYLLFIYLFFFEFTSCVLREWDSLSVCPFAYLCLFSIHEDKKNALKGEG